MGYIFPINQREAALRVNNRDGKMLTEEIWNMYLGVVEEAIYNASYVGLYSCTVYVPNEYAEIITEILWDRDFVYSYNAKFSLLNISWDKSNKE